MTKEMKNAAGREDSVPAAFFEESYLKILAT